MSASEPKAPVTKPRIRAAQYLRMSTDMQAYSTENQRDAIASYAEIMGYDIVATYQDPGRSGLNIDRRPGLQRLLMDVESGQADFETVVVYDVSRWGRFQSIDESASYEYRCQMAGVRIEFCAEQFVNDGTIGSDVLKAIKRSMAAELSRMLSHRVFIGQSRVVKMGFCGGGMPGYGLRRLLVDASGEPKFILKRRQYKSVGTDRVILTHGPPEEVAIVRWMFDQFVKKRKSAREIAEAMNARGLVTPKNSPWNYNSVRAALTNERYIGNIVWNRHSEKLHGRKEHNHPSAWIRYENACKPIVGRRIFSRAREILDSNAPASNEKVLADVANVLKRHGKLSSAIIDAAPDCLSVSGYQYRFGSLQEVYKRIGYDSTPNFRWFDINSRLRRVRLDIIELLLAEIELAGGKARHDVKTRFITVNEEFTVGVWITRCQPTCYGYPHWAFWKARFPKADILVLGRMMPDNEAVRDYIIAPAAEARAMTELLRTHNSINIDMFRFRSMDALVNLAKRGIGDGLTWQGDLTALAQGPMREDREMMLREHISKLPKFHTHMLLGAYREHVRRMRRFIQQANAALAHQESVVNTFRQLLATEMFQTLLMEQGLAEPPRAFANWISGTRPSVPASQREGTAVADRLSIGGICPEVLTLLQDQAVKQRVFRVLRQVVPERQMEMARSMIALNRITLRCAHALLALTPSSQLVDPLAPRRTFVGVEPARLHAMACEFATLNLDFKDAADRRAACDLAFVTIKGYLDRLLDNAKVVRYLALRFPEQLATFQIALGADTQS